MHDDTTRSTPAHQILAFDEDQGVVVTEIRLSEAPTELVADTARMLAARFPAPRYSQGAADPGEALDAG